MRRLLTLTLILSLSSVPSQAQATRRQRSRTHPRHTAGISKESSPPAPSTPDAAPIFLSRQGAASIGEMMNEPPTFSYGSSINIWLITDDEDTIREIAVTGHGDSPTCRRISGKVMGMFLDKQREPDDLFVAGAAHMTDRGNEARRRKLEESASVKAYLQAEHDLQAARVNVRLYDETPGTGAEGKSALGEARAALKKAMERVEELGKDSSVQEYIREGQSADAINLFASDVQRFSQDNGLVIVRQIPLDLISAARSRLTAAAKSGVSAVVAFDDLLAAAHVSEAALITPVLTVPDGRPLELRVPLARMTVSSFEEAQRNNRDEVEKAIIGDVRQRIAIYNESKKDTLTALAKCRGLSPQSMNEIVELTKLTTREGIIRIINKPQRITRRQYCQGQLPLNLQIFDGWIKDAEGLLDIVNKDANLGEDSRLRDFNYTTLIDSMLRNWRLPVARSQTAFDTWRKTIRGPVWATLSAQLERAGIAPNVVGGEQMIFSVQQDGADLIIRPQHVIDMARSVILIDPSAKATRVLDAWSLRSREQVVDSSSPQAAPGVPELIRGLAARVASGDAEGARSRLITAFSLDPEAAFKELEREWLSLFPDTHQRVSEMRQSLQPQVEAIEWFEAFQRFQDNPAYKESEWDYLNAFQNFLDSYPKAPIDLHLSFALSLATKIANNQNKMDREKSPLTALSTETKPWDVLEAFSQPLSTLRPRRGVSTNRGPQVRLSPAALRSWRQRMENILRPIGYDGARLTQMINILENIETSSYARASGQDRYLGGRRFVTLKLFADPAPMILKAVQTVKQRDPEYWAAASRASALPAERSREWKLADEAMQKQLTLFESKAQSLIRLNDWLRKSYWGSQSAQYLWSTPKPDLRALLSLIDAAIGDDSTGSNSAYLGPRETVNLFVSQRRLMDTLTRYQNAAALQSGSEGLLAIARSQIDEDPPKGFRETLPLSARYWFESGDYLKAFQSFFTDTMPVALYHPDIRWQALPGDSTRRPLTVRARLEGEQVIFSAEFEDKKPTDVLAVEGLSAVDSEALVTDFNRIRELPWGESGKASDQILLIPVAVRPAARALRKFLLAQDIRLRVMKSMIYGRNAPGDEFLSMPQGNTAIERERASLDKVKGDQGRLLKVPTLAEVKRIATGRIGRGN